VISVALGLTVALLQYVLPLVFGGDTLWEGHVRGVGYYLHRFGGALVWTSIVVAAVSHGWKAHAFAAAGRTAFTVYILQSVIGLALFSSLGLGLFGQLSLDTLVLVTAGVWVFFLVAAPLWLRSFRFGPLEWLWRSLTYGQVQPLRRTNAQPVQCG
jgi:uncharacterized protein